MSDAKPLIGQSLPRSEDPGFLTGAARYGADLGPGDGLPDRPLLHAVFVRSPYAHAEVTGIDTTAAAASRGVVAVLTSSDVDVFPAGSFHPSLSAAFAQPLLAERRVRYVGEPVAVVVAGSMAEGIDAIELVEVDYDPLPPVLELDDALAGTNLLFPPGTEPRLQPGAAPGPQVDGNIALRVERCGSDPVEPSPFDGADVVIECRVMNPRMSPAPIEPRVVTCWWPEGGPLTVWASTQRPHGHRDELSRLYGLDPAQVVVITPEVGGGFGGKNSRTAEEWLLPLLARELRAPVRWVESRSEYLAAATQSRGERIDFVLAGSRDGRIEALEAELIKDCGAYPITGAVLPGGYTAFTASGPYDIPHVQFAAVCVVTNRVPTSAFRGAGRGPYIAGLERLVDLYAAAIDRDPAEVRRLNLVRPETMPYRTPTGAVYDEADYPADLDAALELIGYDGVRATQRELRAAGGPRQLGIGIGCYNHMTVGGGGEEASVTILSDGRARVITGTTSQGHGHAVTWAQIAADALALPIDRIEVVEGRTDLIATGVGAVGSRSLQTAGIAIHRSAVEVVDRARALAAELLEAAPADVVLDPGGGGFHVVGTPAVAVTWERLASEAPLASAAMADPASAAGTAVTPEGRGQPTELACGERFDNEGRNTYPSGTHVAVVEVDLETGAVRLIRFAAVDDAGRRVNPMIVDGQLHGGIASGIGQVLGEVVDYDERGSLRTATFLDYRIATSDELPFFDLRPAEVSTSFNELGFKGVGESGTIGATPAVHNAVLDAVRPFGVDHLDLPCTSERVWTALRDAGRLRNPPAERVTS